MLTPKFSECLGKTIPPPPPIEGGLTRLLTKPHAHA